MTRRKEYYYPEIEAFVHITIHRSARSFSARVRGGKVYLTVPLGATAEEARKALTSFAPELKKNLAAKSTMFSMGQRLDFGDFVVEIHPQTSVADAVWFQPHIGKDGRPLGVVRVWHEADFSTLEASRTISRSLCRIAQEFAPTLLIPRAKQLAHEVGREPLGWGISKGHRVLGTCSTSGIIKLSAINIFLPQHLRDYIVYHELAHLTEMNHSPRFHEVCNSYCHGREMELKREVDHYKWPILK